MNQFNIKIHTNNNIWIMTLECRYCGMTKASKDYHHTPTKTQIIKEIEVAEIEHTVCKQKS